MIIFIFSLSHPFPTYFGLKGSHKGIFLIFFTIFLEFSITRRVGTERTDNFYFFSFSAVSILFWLEMKPYWYILIFSILLLFFCNFQFRVE